MLDADRGVSFEEGHGKAIEKTLSVQSDLDFRGVLGIVPFGGPRGTRTANDFLTTPARLLVSLPQEELASQPRHPTLATRL